MTTTSQGPSMTTVCFSITAQSDASGAALHHLTMIPSGTRDFQGIFTREERACASVPAQSCLTLWDPMDCSPPRSSVLGILQARTLERVAMPSSRGSSQHRDRTHISCISCTAGRLFATVSYAESLLLVPYTE